LRAEQQRQQRQQLNTQNNPQPNLPAPSTFQSTADPASVQNARINFHNLEQQEKQEWLEKNPGFDLQLQQPQPQHKQALQSEAMGNQQ
jgi:hypothetical protein